MFMAFGKKLFESVKVDAKNMLTEVMGGRKLKSPVYKFREKLGICSG